MPTPAARAVALRSRGVTYPGGIEHIRAVRIDLRALLRDCPHADEIVLCASELAANAGLHSRSRLPGGTFTVRAAVIPGRYVRIEVEDDGGPWTEHMSDTTGHHGWDIIRALANGWGVKGACDTRTVWARFDWPA